jgi:hypothetical protein
MLSQRSRRMSRCAAVVFLLPALWANSIVRAEPAPPTADEAQFFEKRVRPILEQRCFACHSHGAGSIKGGLALDSRSGWATGGDSGPAVVPGKPDESLLIGAVRRDGLEMPPSEKLSAAEVAVLVDWVQRGAPDPRVAAVAKTTKGIDFTAGRKFWSFQPPVRAARPKVNNTAWPRGEIDYFLLAVLEADGLRPVAPATKRELIRRATFDLIGLPPTPAEIDDFLADDSDEAYAKVIDRLLASPHYGERWGRHWLDVARYAEDQAHTFGVKPNNSAYRYRDWVVAALNADMPYDRFVKLQIAADAYAKNSPEPTADIAALGLFGLGAQYYKNSDAAKAAADELDDRVDVLTRGFLGLTVSCARCHDHKFDPIAMTDYYGLAGIFRSCKLSDTPLAPADEVKAYNEAKQREKAADDALKNFVKEQKERTAEADADEIAEYLEAAWLALHGPASDPKQNAKQLAKDRKLHEGKLNRWIEVVRPGAPLKHPALADFRKTNEASGGKKADQVPAAVTKAADALEQKTLAMLAERERLSQSKPNKKAKLPVDDAGWLKVLFADRDALFGIDDGELKRRLAADMMQRWTECNEALDAAKKAVPPMYAVAHTIADAQPANMNVFLRGNPAQPGEVAPRRFLRVIAGDDGATFADGSGRRELAEAIADPQNPLTARVMVNRLWQHHFGRGLVATPSNFGLLGERPSHPELLDYLAIRFVENGWSMKAMHREMMLSAAYQMSSRHDEKNGARDPDNRRWWRMPRVRLDVEVWRDAMLAVSGRLDATLGGAANGAIDDVNSTRRTFYGKISRHDLNGLLRLFDFPDANITADVRTETTVPQQQLFALNSPFVAEQAKSFAKRLQRELKNADDGARVRQAFLLAYGRPAEKDEVQSAVAFLTAEDSAAEAAQNKLTRWERLTQALLAANEFLYVD